MRAAAVAGKPMRQFLFLTSSARVGGNTETLARIAARPLPQSAQHWIDLTGLPPYHDQRPVQPPPEGRLATLAAGIEAATDIVFVAPIYWYALPAPAKLLLDHWSGWLDVPGMGFGASLHGKHLWLITVRADADPTVAAGAEAMLRRAGAWLGMVWGGALHGIGTEPGDVLADKPALAGAKALFNFS